MALRLEFELYLYQGTPLNLNKIALLILGESLNIKWRRNFNHQNYCLAQILHGHSTHCPIISHSWHRHSHPTSNKINLSLWHLIISLTKETR